MKLSVILITIILGFTIKDVIANRNENQCNPLIDKKCIDMQHGNTCDLINDPDCAMKIIAESDAHDKETNARPCGPFDKRRKCYKPLHYPHAFYIGNPNVKYPNAQSIPQKHLDDLITEQLNAKDPFAQYLQDIKKPNSNHHGQRPHSNYHDNKKPHRPMSHHTESNRPEHHHQQESSSTEWSHPLSHKHESNHPDSHKPDLHRPKPHSEGHVHSMEHSLEWEHPMKHRPDLHRPEFHRPVHHGSPLGKPVHHLGHHSSEYNDADSHRPHVEAYYQNNKRPQRPQFHNPDYDSYKPHYKPVSQNSHYEYKRNSHEIYHSHEASSEEEHSWKPYFPQNYYSTNSYYNKYKPNYHQEEYIKPIVQRPHKPSKYGYYNQEPQYQGSVDGSHVTQQFGSGYFDQRRRPYTNTPQKFDNIFSKHKSKSQFQHSSEEYAMELFNNQNLKTIQVPDTLLDSTEFNIRELQLGGFAI